MYYGKSVCIDYSESGGIVFDSLMKQNNYASKSLFCNLYLILFRIIITN